MSKTRLAKIDKHLAQWRASQIIHDFNDPKNHPKCGHAECEEIFMKHGWLICMTCPNPGASGCQCRRSDGRCIGTGLAKRAEQTELRLERKDN